MRPNVTRRGFTLIEILIVVSIIALLTSIILAAVTIARKSTSIAIAKSTVSTLKSELAAYVQDTGRYPGGVKEYKDGENAFPALFAALFEEKPPKGRGGPSAPYGKFKEENVLVWDREREEYRQAESDEIWDTKIDKFLGDPWGSPYVYHENKSRPRRPYMHDPNADIYSMGPDRYDQTGDGEKGKDIDDVGSW